MTVGQLIKELKKYHKDLPVSVSMGDNSNHEVAAWVDSVHLKNKLDLINEAHGLTQDRHDIDIVYSYPESFVDLHC